MMSPSLYWHDYETFGIDPRRDRPSQFAGVRTDLDLNVIDDPVVVYCKPPADYLPHPESCLLTGITPQIAKNKGVNEAEFCRLIHEQLAQPSTCSLGYNSLRFDDEFTRNCLYRNFYDPYAREWQNGNSRWDLIDVVRATRAFRPDGINWPVDDEGNAVLKLEALTKANNIQHEAAHDALSDVYATIALAKLIKQKQPKLYQFLWSHRNKADALKLLQFGTWQPVLHVSGRYHNSKYNMAVVLPLSKHPINNNGFMVYDLSVDPEPLISLSVQEIQQRIFTATADLPDGMERIPLKTVHINKCPVLAPINVLKADDLQRLNLDLMVCTENIAKLKAALGLSEKIQAVFANNEFGETDNDPDLAIYSGGFFSDKDKQKLAKIKTLTPDELMNYAPKFSDDRLPEMLFRYRARNFPETLNTEETNRWQQFCADKLSGLIAGAGINFPEFFSELSRVRMENPTKEKLFMELEHFAKEKARNLGLSNILPK